MCVRRQTINMNRSQQTAVCRCGVSCKHIIDTIFNFFYLPCHWIVFLSSHSIESANQSKALQCLQDRSTAVALKSPPRVYCQMQKMSTVKWSWCLIMKSVMSIAAWVKNSKSAGFSFGRIPLAKYGSGCGNFPSRRKCLFHSMIVSAATPLYPIIFALSTANLQQSIHFVFIPSGLTTPNFSSAIA